MLSLKHQKLHDHALRLCARHKSLEADIVFLLADLEKEQVFKRLGFASLFEYAVSLGLSEANAYAFILVSRKASELAPVREAILSKTLAVSKAARMVSVLNESNAVELVEFAKRHTSKQIDQQVAHLRPRSRARDRVSPLSPEWSKLEGSISQNVAVKLKRAQSVLSSKLGLPADLNATLEASLDLYLSKHDPVERAKRAWSGPQKQRAPREASVEMHAETTAEFCSSKTRRGRTPLTAMQKHEVHRRDQGRCTFVIPETGERCSQDRWLQIHHIQSVREGGGNDPSNLQTLCAVHHDLTHQLSLPLTGQVTWLRSPQVRYGQPGDVEQSLY